MKLHRLFLISGFISVGAGTAWAGEHDGVAVGARAEAFVYGVGAEYWRGPLAVSATVGGYLSRQRESAPELPDSELHSTSLGGSLGGLIALSDGPRARLAVGARAVYLRFHGGYGGDAGWTYQALSLQLPLRIQVWLNHRVALHTEVGLELGLAGNRNTAAGGAAAGEGDARYLAVFGHPLGNLGVSYCF